MRYLPLRSFNMGFSAAGRGTDHFLPEEDGSIGEEFVYAFSIDVSFPPRKVSIGLRIPSAQAEKLKRRFGLGQNPTRNQHIFNYATRRKSFATRAMSWSILDSNQRMKRSHSSVRWKNCEIHFLPGITAKLDYIYSIGCRFSAFVCGNK
jgi:hypothetical protein